MELLKEVRLVPCVMKEVRLAFCVGIKKPYCFKKKKIILELSHGNI